MAVKFAVYTCQPIPTAKASPDPSSEDSGLWSPLSCTLIYTPAAALLVDCPASVAATAELAAWVRSTLPAGCELRHFVASHAHGDHFLGFPVLRDAFPLVVPTATEKVATGIVKQYTPPIYEGNWKIAFPPAEAGTGLPEAKADFVPLPPSNEIRLDGGGAEAALVRLYDVPHGDTHSNSFVHVPAIGLVVAGDIVYNGDCHQWLGEASTQAKRDQWVQALSQIAALRPSVVVPGHTFAPMAGPSEAAARAMLDGTEQYIRALEEELAQAASADALFEKMRARFARWNLYILKGSCQAAFANKQSST